MAIIPALWILKSRWEDRYYINHYKQLQKHNIQRDEWAAMGVCYWEDQSGLGYQGKLAWSTNVEPEIHRMYKGSNGSIPSEGIAVGRAGVQRTPHSCT